MSQGLALLLPTITVDGGAACGKGAVALGIAKALGFNYLDSGVFYRALGYRALVAKVDSNDQPVLIEMACSLKLTFLAGKIFLNHEGLIDITQAIRTEEVSVMSSKVSMWQGVRDALMLAQRAALIAPGLVAEGRDMGTVVFPHAEVKFFMHCDLQERARRRVLQLANQGINVTIEDVCQALAERDDRDLNRAVAPLKPASSAVVIDNTTTPLDDVVAQCVRTVRERLQGLIVND